MKARATDWLTFGLALVGSVIAILGIVVLTIAQSALATNLIPTPLRAQAPVISVSEVRTLPTPQLARALLGERLASRVIEAVRHDYGTAPGIPSSVDFYTQPEAPWPRISRICRTDVITIEYNWFDLENVQPSTPVTIDRVEATSRYLAIPEPRGDPGTPDYDRRHVAACAGFRSALNAFRAPDAGDAQWLAALEAEWRQAGARPRFTFRCNDFADASCGHARQALAGLMLIRAANVRSVDCPTRPSRPRDWVSFCYRLSFMYAGSADPEWLLTVVGGMRDGMGPVEIRSLGLEHVGPPRDVF